MTITTHCHECMKPTDHAVVKTETYHETGATYQDLRCTVCRRFTVHVRVQES